MRSLFLVFLSAISVSLLIAGCSHAPEGVIGEEEMAQIMADMDLAEALVEMDYNQWASDSTRRMLKQSILLRHGITQEEMDTSMMWYGNHIEEYLKMTDRSIELLQERQRDLAVSTTEQIAISGDSVDLWQAGRSLRSSFRNLNDFATFAFLKDSTWRNGDVYTFKFKLINHPDEIPAQILVDYDEGVTDIATASPATGSGWTILRITPDSTLTPRRIYGYINLRATRESPFQSDSIMLTRLRKEIAGPLYASRQRVYLTSDESVRPASPRNGAQSLTPAQRAALQGASPMSVRNVERASASQRMSATRLPNGQR